MANKLTEVNIGGKAYKLSGEDSEHIKEVAEYVDNKLRELNRVSSTNIMTSSFFPIILALNISDDLFKERQKVAELEGNGTDIKLVNTINDEETEKFNKKISVLESDLKTKEKELAELKYKLSNKETEFESVNSELTEIRTNYDSVKTRVETAEKKVLEKSNYISSLTEKISSKNQELNTLSNKLAEKNNQLNELNQKSAEKNIKLNNVNKERDELAYKLKQTRLSLEAAEAEKDTLLKNMEELKQSHAEELKLTKAGSTDMIDKLTSELGEANEKLDAITNDYELIKKEFRAFQSTETDSQLQTAFAKIRTENIDLRREVDELKRRLRKH